VWRSHGQEAKRGEASGHRIPWNCEAIGPFTSRVRHRVVPDRDRVPDRCNTSGSAVDVRMTLSHECNGLSARRMAVWYTWRAPSLCRHVHRELMRSALLDLTPIIAATTCNQRNYVERYSRYNPQAEGTQPTRKGMRSPRWGLRDCAPRCRPQGPRPRRPRPHRSANAPRPQKGLGTSNKNNGHFSACPAFVCRWYLLPWPMREASVLRKARHQCTNTTTGA
jgi:hypothetical protein